MSGVINVWCDQCLVCSMSFFTHSVINVWCDQCLCDQCRTIVLEYIDIDIDIDKDILENIDIDIEKKISENIDSDKILNRLEFGILNRATCRYHQL